MDEADGVSGADGGVAQGLSEKAQAHAGGSDHQNVLVLVQKLQREDSVQQPAVQGN